MTKLDATLWSEIMAYLHCNHGPLCRQWFEELKPIGVDAGLLKVHTSNRVQQNYLQRRCLEQFTEAAQSATGALVAVRFVSDLQEDSNPPNGNDDLSAFEPQKSPQTVADSTGARASTFEHNQDDPQLDKVILNPDYRFANFVTGPGNQLACAASLAVASQPGEAYNPLYIHGGCGLGKTHLLQAICQAISQHWPRTRICFLPCDVFMNDFLDCVQRGQMSQFRHRYRHVDLLVIDDIQFLANRERTQEEFFHTFNALYQSKRQIVLSSDCPPDQIPQLEQRLVSRFQWGLITSIDKPDFETRVAIVRAKAKLRGLELSGEVIEYISNRIDSNARELEGAMTTIQGHAALRNRPIDLALAHQALGETPSRGRGTCVTMQNIIDVVTHYYSVKLGDLQSKRRHRSITGPRQVCMWLTRKWTEYSLEEIGGHFGGRDHTTVMHSIRTVDQRLDQDTDFAVQIDQIEKMLQSK